MKLKLIRFFYLFFYLDDDLSLPSESSNSNRVLFEDEVPAENQNVTSDPVTYERLDAKILPGVKMHAYGK